MAQETPMKKYEFTYRSTPESVGVMLDELEVVLSQHEVSEPTSRRICLAVSEAFTNALLHGNKRDPHKVIKLALKVNDQEVVADIVDQGTGGLGRIQGKKPADTLDENGRGVDLIRHYATSVRFDEKPSGGLRVSIVFSRKDKKYVTNT